MSIFYICLAESVFWGPMAGCVCVVELRYTCHMECVLCLTLFDNA